MAKREFVIFLATLVMFADSNRVPRNSLNQPSQVGNGEAIANQPKVPDGVAHQGSKVAAVGSKIETPKVVNSPKLIDKAVANKESSESSSESDETSLFSSAAGLIAGVINSGRRNLDALKSVPVVGNVVPMMDPLINGVSKIVQRSVDNASEANLVELHDLYNRTNVLVKKLNEKYNALAHTEEDNKNLEKYAESVLQHFYFQNTRYNYKTNYSNIALAFLESLNELIKRRNYTAVQFSAPLVRAAGVYQSVISLPVELVHTVCRIDTPDDECIKNVVGIIEIANIGECGSGDQIKLQIFKIALENVNVEGTTAIEVHRNIVNKVKAKMATTRRKRNCNLAANNLQANVPVGNNNAETKPDAMAVRRTKRNIAGNSLQANAPTGINNAVNPDTKPLSGLVKPNVNAKPNLAPNPVLNNVGNVPGIQATNTNDLAKQNPESRRMNNNNLATNQARNIPGVPATNILANQNVDIRRMNNVGVSEKTLDTRTMEPNASGTGKPIDVKRAGTNTQANTNIGLNDAAANLNQAQAPSSNLVPPSRRSNTEELTHSDVFDLIIAELKALQNNVPRYGCKVFEAIANAQKENTLCNVLMLDKVLEFTP